MKIKTHITFCMLLMSVAANGATLSGTSFNFSASQITAGGVLLDGVAATSGQVNANFGYFNTGFDVVDAVTSNDLAALFANFNLVSSALVGATSSLFGEDYAGLFDGGAPSFSANVGDPSIGNNIFGFYSFGSSLTLSNLQQAWGLVDSGIAITVDGFPPTSYVVYPTTGTFVGGSTGSGFTTATFTATAIGETGVTAPALNLVVIPEPSVALLGAFGVLGLLRRRR